MSFEGPSQMNSEEQLSENPIVANSEHSSEMLKINVEVGKTAEAVGALLYEFRNRNDQRLTDFLDDTGIDRMSRAFADLNSLDVYTDQDLEKTGKVFADLCSGVDSIEMQVQSRNMEDDPDSLHSLVWKLNDISEQAGNIEFALKKLNTGPSLKVAEYCEKLREISNIKARYITERVEALVRYLS